MSRMLVTGGAGFIGSHVGERLLALGHRVTVLDDLSMGRREFVPPGAELVEGSVLDRELVRSLVHCSDAVLHQAAKVSIRSSIENVREDAAVNVMGTVELLAALRGSPVRRFVYASSMGVYPRDGLSVKEDEAGPMPPSPYGIGKLASEHYVFSLCEALGVGAVALRYSNTYGVRQTWTPYVGVVTIFVNRILRGQPPLIFGDGEQVRDYVHVSDIVEANVRALATDKVGEAYNVGTGVGTTVNQVLALVERALGVEGKPVHEPPQRGELRAFTADTEKAQRLLGFRTHWRLEEKIGEIVEYWRGRPREASPSERPRENDPPRSP